MHYVYINIPGSTVNVLSLFAEGYSTYLSSIDSFRDNNMDSWILSSLLVDLWITINKKKTTVEKLYHRQF